jgi:hypothetical protein
MATHTVQIGDGSGNSMEISVTIGYLSGQGSWRALDLGYLRYTSGTAIERGNSGSSTSYDLFCYGPDGVDAGWGINLSVYEDYFTGTNDGGTGSVAQPWVLQLSPGAISWALAD